MAKVFAENFQHDVAGTIMSRYPGSVREDNPLDVDITKSFPLRRYNKLEFGSCIERFNRDENHRIEIILKLDGPKGSGATVATGGLDVFGLKLGYAATGSNSTLQGMAVGDLTDVGKIHIVVECKNSMDLITLLLDDEVVMYPTILLDWEPSTNIYANFANATTSGGYFRRQLTEVVVSIDNDDTIGNVEYNKFLYEVNESGGWTATEGTIQTATDTDDPTSMEPNVYNSDVDGKLILSSAADKDTTFYIAGMGNLPMADLTVNDSGYLLSANSSNALSRLDVLPGEAVSVGIDLDRSYFKYNNDGVGFGGEIGADQFATFQELSVLCGLGSTGTLNTGNGVDRFLRFMIDGEELIVPKIGMRHTISWQQIYQAGLVYGVDGFGLSPSGANKNQKVIIEVKGRQYQVSLLTGTNSNPSGFTAGGYDTPAIARSQFSRLFYPLVIDDPNLTSYTDIKLAEYTMADLRLINTSGNGSYNWVQETQGAAASDANRHYRGRNGPSNVNSHVATVSSSSSSWRPAFKRLS